MFELLSKQLSIKLNKHISETGGALLALSGGMDSICLLHLLAARKNELHFPLRAVHVDHGIRSGAESEQDLNCVRSQCRILGIELLIFRAPAGEIARWQRKTGGY